MYSEASRRQFWNKVRIDRESGCWIWIGRLIKGYGTFSVGGKQVYAHRYSYEFVHGRVPPGLELHHICDNKSCVNPHHVVPVFHSENMRQAALRLVWSGGRNGNSKLVESQVLEIKRALKQGVPVMELAMRFNVSPRMVYYIAAEKNWKHVNL